MRRETQAVGVGRVTMEMSAGLVAGDHLEELGVDGRKVLEWSLKSVMGRRGLDMVTHDRDKWQAFVGAVMNCRFPSNARNCVTS
jgi:hypothetical protein